MNLPEDDQCLRALHSLLEQAPAVQLRQTVQQLLFRSLLLEDTKALDHDGLKDVELLLAFLDEIGGCSCSRSL